MMFATFSCYNVVVNKVIDVLKKVYSRIPNDLQKNVVLVGSVNLYLQGVDVTPKKDIDLATDFKTVEKLASLFSESTTRHCAEPTGDDYLPFAYLFIEEDGYEIEFFDAVSHGESYYLGSIASKNIIEVNREDFVFQSLKLTEELEVYKKSGKAEKIQALRIFLNK